MHTSRPAPHTLSPPRLRRFLAAPLVAIGLATAATGGPAMAAPAAGAAASPDPLVAPVTTLAADGRSATDGQRTLTVSQAVGLGPGGQSIQVSGAGYDTSKGIYVALCVIPPRNVLPTPCGGGVDVEGQAGASQWISSNPPSYGVGLALPWGPGGSFSVNFRVSAVINPTVDCRTVRCAVVTRSDHTRTSDRSQDIFIPVSFAQPTTPGAPTVPPQTTPNPAAPAAGAQVGGVVTTPSATPPSPTTTGPTPTSTAITTTTTTAPPPTTTLAADALSVTDGTRILRADKTADLDPGSTMLEVSGSGFDPARGVYVSLCRLPGTGAAPGPCLTGSPEVSAWISTNPPEWGAAMAEPWGDGGSFSAALAVKAKIDADTDCREVPCGIVVGSDDTAPDDRSLDLALPVSFADEAAAGSDGSSGDPETSETGGETAASTVDDASGGPGAGLAVAGGATACALAAGGVIWWRRRNSSGAHTEGPNADLPTTDGPHTDPEPA